MLSFSPRPPGEIIRRASEASDTEELERFLQARVRLFVGAMAGLFTVLYVGGMLLIGLFAPAYWVAIHVHPAKWLNLIVAVALAAAYFVLRRRTFARPALLGVDLGVSLAIMSAIGIALSTAPGGYQLEFAGLLVMVVLLTLRAAVVPSTAGFTALVSGLCAVPLLAGAYVH